MELNHRETVRMKNKVENLSATPITDTFIRLTTCISLIIEKGMA